MTATVKSFIFILLMLMAWTFLYAASHQVFVPGWSVAGFLNKTKTFHDLFAVFTGPRIAPVITFLVEYGHLLIGVSLFLGLMVRISGAVGILLNGKPLELIHGFPVRLVIGAWPGSVSSKWLTRVWVRDTVHDGQGMGGTSYRVAIKPIVPGGKADPTNFTDLESMPVRSIITNPANGTKLAAGSKELKLRGAAWAGDNTIKSVDLSINFGASWQRAELGQPKNRYDWQRWTTTLKLPRDGYYEVWARATDSRGMLQPHIAGNWNPQGYGGNPMHRIAVLVG